MSNRLIQYGFTGGHISKTLWSQTTLNKYGFGFADSDNFIVNYVGSLISRPGLIAGSLLSDATEPFRFVPFIFAEDDINTFSLYFTAGKLRVFQAGRYQLEEEFQCAKIASTTTESTITTYLAHNYAVDDLVELSGTGLPAQICRQVVRVTEIVDARNFKVQTLYGGKSLDEVSLVTDFFVARVYTLVTPFTVDDLANMSFSQVRDVVRITSHNFSPLSLERQADNTWALKNAIAEELFPSPENVALKSVSDAGTAGVFYTVTAVNGRGEESLAKDYLLVDSSVNIATESGTITIEWDAVTDASYYNVYRSVISDSAADISLAGSVGFAGKAIAPSFFDNNIVPDFTKSPPNFYNPFSKNSISYVNITAKGTGYSRGDTITVTDATGSGALLIPIVSDGELVGVLVSNPGKDYTAPVLTVNTSGGSGAVFDVVLGASEGVYPRVSAVHAQRQLYANTQASPLAFWGSQSGLFDNFNLSPAATASDSFSYELGSKVLGEILHMIDTRAGLLLFTNIGVWAATGSNGTIAPGDIEAQLQTKVGSSLLTPLEIDSDILYMETGTRTARLLKFNDFSKNFGGTDVSVLAVDLFAKQFEIVSWTYETRPYKTVWAVRNDGELVSGALASEQEVYAWATHSTAGLFEDIHTLPNSAREVTYAIVKRRVGNDERRYIEYFAARDQSTNNHHVGVDCAIGYGADYQNVDAFLAGNTLKTATALFTAGDVGKAVIHRDGKGIITAFVSSTEVTLTIIAPFTHLAIKHTNYSRKMNAGSWIMTDYKREIYLPLNHRPETVAVAMDGKYFEEQPVLDFGKVEFSEELSYGQVGFAFNCYVETLPLKADGAIIEDSRKRIVGVGVRFVDSKGINVGTIYDEDEKTIPYPVSDHFGQVTAESTRTFSAHEYVPVESEWDESARIYITGAGAFPIEITGLVFDVDVGDDVQ